MQKNFKKNKYFIWYYAIINNAISQNRTKFKKIYYENHHIVPKSIGGTNEKHNLVLLTGKEHFICHHLLTKFTIGKAKYSMYNAFFQMFIINANQPSRYNATARTYTMAKELMAQSTSKNHLNKIYTENTKTRIREGLSIGIFITPWGEFKNIGAALKVNKCMSNMSLSRYCQNPNSKLTNKSQIQSSYFNKADVGKSFKDLGFGFVPR